MKAYINKEGFVVVKSIDEYYFDYDDPLDILIFKEMWFNKYDEVERNEILYKGKEKHFVFGIFKDRDGFLHLTTRKKANVLYLYISESDAFKRFSTTNKKEIIKIGKRIIRDLVTDYNYALEDKLCSVDAYSLTGDYIEWMSFYGDNIYTNGVVSMYGKPISKVYEIKDNYIEKEKCVNNETFLAYLMDNYTYSNLMGDLIEFDFGKVSDIFSKEDIVNEFFSRCKVDNDFRKYFNEACIHILTKYLEELSI